MRLAATLVAASLLVAAQAAATAPPCDFPSCYGMPRKAGKLKRVLVSADGKLVVRMIDTDASPVLVEVVRDGVVEPVVTTLLKPKVRNELVRAGWKIDVMLTTAGTTWETATTATLADGTTLTYDAKATKRLDKAALYKRFRTQSDHAAAVGVQQRATTEVAKELETANATCGTALTYQLDWSKLPDSVLADGWHSAEHECPGPLGYYLEQHCKTDAGKAATAAKLKGVVCEFRASGVRAAKLSKDGILTLPLPLEKNASYKQGTKSLKYLEKLFGTDYFVH